MASLFQSTLADLVASMRSSSLGGASFLDNALAECKKEIRSTDPHSKATALQKVPYIAMLQVGAELHTTLSSSWDSVRSAVALLHQRCHSALSCCID